MMTVQERCQALSAGNNAVVLKILMARGLKSLRDIPNYDSLILDTHLAYSIAVAAHTGVVDKGGNPYIGHPVAVASQFTCTYRASAGYLHDVVEDNANYSFRKLQHLGVHPRVIKALRVLTHKSGSYEDYIYGVATDPISVDVKMADILHNSDLSRLKTVDNRVLERLERYNAALQYFAVHNFGLR